jgi:membrane-associated HD superfamily phosphohydrolase
MDNSEKSPTLETKKTALNNSDLVKQTPVNKTVTENIAKSAVANITPEQVTVKQAAIKQKPEHISEKGVVLVGRD